METVVLAFGVMVVEVFPEELQGNMEKENRVTLNLTLTKIRVHRGVINPDS